MKPLGLRAPARGQVSTDVKNLWNVPRCKVWRSAGLVSFGPGAGTPVWDTVEMDSDDMTAGMAGSGAIKCQTKGIYWASTNLHVSWPASAGVLSIWHRLIINGAAGAYVAGTTDQDANTNSFFPWNQCQGYWNANPGDIIQPYTYVDQTVNFEAGIDNLWMEVCWIRSQP